MKKPLIILTGPTAVGKTSLSVRLAKMAGGEIISADSMQVYKGMDIGSAKIMPEEMQGVRHYLIDELSPKEEFNVVKFQEYAKKYIEEIYARGRVPILTGGTGFYIQSVLYDIDFTETEENREYREYLEGLAKEKGPLFLHGELQKVDPLAAEQIHANNVKRVIRALEYFRETGEPISKHNEEERKKESPYNFAYFVLNDRRDVLYDRINKRIDMMLEAGLIEEVKRLKGEGCTRNMVSMQGLGYKEILDYLDGRCTLEEAVYILKRDTRHFAKRQLTWFKRERDVIWVNKDEFSYSEEKILAHMDEILIQKGILNERRAEDDRV
ncbi:tRNA (adenosine(37)-N6)-dimethylallyltransferase MiaA [Murimonas intestini]|uniref:tRNA dimethylallyltransferase n=1 Tax=Murimonas intestini TaxID=1337051 RepID=A0AB73T9Z7_9FIRM|nr:tRNA (adenosine(37)-N6)-dimethylallyltransferase MiaA [Murimonas intestini]MCR1839069.1 tRNA (adenosine(37)-N6)-dimethylallyltransferase MiaA [Murimonas intestini]MCR1864365.1 tRNA (adenosine(37)-N6)-dimethylallyltransferase MiaA [Murimonas intestini]MCR1881975.1 tRNA (adenosine(37)-N6)-dimethylallyltransferase MiaA [Murimonas intestini]